jgi:hypothetical protein
MRKTSTSRTVLPTASPRNISSGGKALTFLETLIFCMFAFVSDQSKGDKKEKNLDQERGA